MAHICDAIIVHCIDFRFQKFIRDWSEKELSGKKYDVVSYAGSTKDLDTIMGQIDISVKLHQIKEVYLIHHENCGAYGEESTLERHTQDLNKAKDMVLNKHPQLNVHLMYLTLQGEFQPIS